VIVAEAVFIDLKPNVGLIKRLSLPKNILDSFVMGELQLPGAVEGID
jgi:hypothetical protein